MKKTVLTFTIENVEFKGDKIIVKLSDDSRDRLKAFAFDYAIAGKQLEEYINKNRKRLRSKSLEVTYIHSEVTHAKFEDGPEFSRKTDEIKALEQKASELLADFQVRFNTYIERIKPETEKELLIKAHSLPLLLKYWPLSLLYRYGKDKSMLKRVTVLLKLLQIVNINVPSREYDPYHIDLRFTQKLEKMLSGCYLEWDEVLLYLEEQGEYCSSWYCFSDDSTVRDQLQSFGLKAKSQEDELIICYLDYLTRLIAFAYERDVKAFEESLPRGNVGFFSSEKLNYSESDTLKRNIQKLEMFRLESDFLAGNKIPNNEMSGIIHLLNL